MKCIRTKQIHEYNSNIIYTQYKQHKASTNTYTPILPSFTVLIILVAIALLQINNSDPLMY